MLQHTDVGRGEAATFACAAPLITRTFSLAMHSALHSAQWQFLDTPTREKGQFLADAVDISTALMGGYRDRAFTRKAIREILASQHRYWPDGRLNAVYPNGDGKRDIPDFTELFPGWVWDYHMESGDLDTLAAAYPAMARICGYLLRHRDPDTRLITNLSGGSGPYEGGIVDWPPTMRYGYDMDVIARTTVNLLAVDALRRTAQAASAIGCPPADASALIEASATLEDAINARLRRPDDGAYIDGLHAGGVPSAHASQIANAYALVFGVAPVEERPRIADHVAALGTRMGPMTIHRLLDAFASCGRIDDIVARLTDLDSPGWADILTRGATFTWESWDAPERENSLSHGWGSTVLASIQRHLLGVAVTAPGAARVRVRPAMGALAWAQGRVPTQRGHVRVAWKRRADGATVLDVHAPPNVEAEVALPDGKLLPVGSDGFRWEGRA
jgi:alpha-L-rhamnosidase